MARQLRPFFPILVLALVFGVGLWLGTLYFGRDSEAFTAAPATLLPQPKPLAPFSLQDHRGHPFTLEQMKGSWSFLFFGYTNCPDVCPNTLTVLNIVDGLVAEGLGDPGDVSFVFISVDPQRDTLEQLRSYVPYFNKELLGVTGTKADIDALSRQVGVLYMYGPEDEAGNYMVDHTASVMLVNPAGQWHAVFSAPHEPEAVADAFMKIYKHYQ